MAHGDSYAFGNCTWYVAKTLSWVPDGWGNAGDWARHAIADSFSVVGFPLIGSVVCYGGGDGYSPLGHVAIVDLVYPNGEFLVSEMNFVAFDQVDERVSTTNGVAGFIEAPPGSPPPPGQGAGAGSDSDANVTATTAVWDGMRGYWNGGTWLQLLESAAITVSANLLAGL